MRVMVLRWVEVGKATRNAAVNDVQEIQEGSSTKWRMEAGVRLEILCNWVFLGWVKGRKR